MAHYPVDLHTHSTASDGMLTPTALVALAAERGVCVIGLADHDTVGGIDEAMAAAGPVGVTVVPAVEFSTRHQRRKQFVGIHLLGYFIDHHHPALQTALKKIQQARVEQKIRQIEKLQAFGFDVPVDEVLRRASGVPGRPHIVSVLLERNPGRFQTVQQVFDEYLGVGKKAHVGRSFALTVANAIDLVRQAGGLPVLAHPAAYAPSLNVEAMVKNAAAAGVKGLEVYYPYTRHGNREALIARLEALARKHGLVMTGGTDFHGRANDLAPLGDMGLSKPAYQALLKAHSSEKEGGGGRSPVRQENGPAYRAGSDCAVVAAIAWRFTRSASWRTTLKEASAAVRSSRPNPCEVVMMLRRAICGGGRAGKTAFCQRRYRFLAVTVTSSGHDGTSPNATSPPCCTKAIASG